MPSDTTVFSIAAVLFKKAATIIAIHGQKHYTNSSVKLDFLERTTLILRQ